MPEPIQSLGTNLCQVDEPEALVCREPPSAPPTAHYTTESPPRDPVVSHLVEAHTRAQSPAPDCRAEGVALASAGIRASLSLAGIVVAAPTELALPIALGKFLVDAIAVGTAAAELENCKDSVPPRSR